MRIILKCPEKPKEWFLIELQGTLTFNATRSRELPTERTFGQFLWKNGKPFLIIGDGQFELEGEEVVLKKPLVVVHRVEKYNTPTSASEEEVTTKEMPFSARDKEKLNRFDFHCVAVIRKKYLFTKRPQLVFRG
jgi:hypothetical protein